MSTTRYCYTYNSRIDFIFSVKLLFDLYLYFIFAINIDLLKYIIYLCVFYSQISIIEFSFLKSKSKPLILNRKCILSHKFISHNPSTTSWHGEDFRQKMCQIQFVYDYIIVIIIIILIYMWSFNSIVYVCSYDTRKIWVFCPTHWPSKSVFELA